MKLDDTENNIQIESLNDLLKKVVCSGRKVMSIKKIQLTILFQIMCKLMESSSVIMKNIDVNLNDSLHKDVVFFEDTRYICSELYNNLSKKLVY